MNPNMNLGREFSIQQEKEIGGPWFPMTPDKSILMTSPLMPVDRQGSPVGKADWQELPRYPPGFEPETRCCIGAIENFNPIRSVELIGGNYSSEVALPGRNRVINNIAGLYARSLSNGSTGLNGICIENLLTINNAAASVSPVNETRNCSIHPVGRNLGHNLYSQVDNNAATSSVPANGVLNGGIPSGNRHTGHNLYSQLDSNVATSVAPANGILKGRILPASRNPSPNLYSQVASTTGSSAAPANGTLNRGIRPSNRHPGLNLCSQVDSSAATSVASANVMLNRNIHPADRNPSPNLYSAEDNNWGASGLLDLLLGKQNDSLDSNLWENAVSLAQMPQYQFPTPYRPSYDLNSPQPTKAEAASSITNAFQFAPVTPDQTKKLENKQLSDVVNLLVDESSSQKKDKQGSLVSLLNDEAIDHHCDELLQNIVESSSAAISTPFKEKSVVEKGSEQDIDLNKTPQQKPARRRKHRPKVISEGKPRKTPKPTMPINTNLKESPSGKRKYVRRNAPKSLPTQQADISKETTDSSVKSSAKTCRRVLNFNMEKTIDKHPGNIVGCEELQNRNDWVFNLNFSPQAIEPIGINSISGTESAMQNDQQNGLVIKSPQAERSFHLNHSPNQIPVHYISQPEKQTPTTPQAKMRDLQVGNLNVNRKNVNTRDAELCQSSCMRGFSTVHRHIHAEGTDQVLFQAQTNWANLERTGQLLLPSTSQPGLNNLADGNQSRGPKRDYCSTVEQTYPRTANLMGPSLLRPEIYQVDSDNNNCSNLGTGSLEIHKKMKFGSLDTGISNIPSHVAVDGGSNQITRTCKSDATENHSTTKIKPSKLKASFESDASRKQNNGISKCVSDWYNPSTAAEIHLTKQHNSPELNSYKGRTGDKISNGNTQVFKFTAPTTTPNYNLLPPTPPKKAPATVYGQGFDSCTASISAKTQALKSTSLNSESPGTDKVLRRKDYNTSYNHQPSPMKTTGSHENEEYLVSIDEIISRLRNLNLNDKSDRTQRGRQNAVVPYREDSIVLYEGFDHIRKRKPRPKVDLDPETNRTWKLLMDGDGSEGANKTDADREKYWEEERKVFQGRADSFIARMHLVQGDRRFSQWKGSVVDSVIGVFLTQNVSDHLSSSAFMSLAARFPLQSASNNGTCYKDETGTVIEKPELSIPEVKETIKWHEKAPSQPAENQRPMVPAESSKHSKKIPTSGTKAIFVEDQNQRVEKEIIPSQEYLDSVIIKAAREIKSCPGSNLVAEDSTTITCKPNKIHDSTSIDLLQMSEASMSQGLYSHGITRSYFYESSQHGHKQLEDGQYSMHTAILDRVDRLQTSSTSTCPMTSTNPCVRAPIIPSNNYWLHMTPESGVLEVECSRVLEEESITSWPLTASRTTRDKDVNRTREMGGQMARSIRKPTAQQSGLQNSQETTHMGPYALPILDSIYQPNSSQPKPHRGNNQHSCNNNQHESIMTFQMGSSSVTWPEEFAEVQVRRHNNVMQDVPNVHNLVREALNVNERIPLVQVNLKHNVVEPNIKDQINEENSKASKAKKEKVEGKKKIALDWESLRKQAMSSGTKKERSRDAMDSLDYEAMRHAAVNAISNAIKERGMNNMLAERIKDFLDRLVKDHGSIDLEWLRDVPPDKAKDYLLSIRGLGLKSVECVRLLTLHHLAFPVDTNVGRIAVRLGWVPLQPLPESLQLHLLELYPVLETIQRYLWPRLCKLDQRTLYELHYQMITFGKVFCTKNRPNCNACPMRGECRHFASAFASARFALPGLEEKSIVSTPVPISTDRNHTVVINHLQLPSSENDPYGVIRPEIGNCEPIIEVPTTPEPESTETTENDIEDEFYEDPDEIPTIKLNIEEFTTNLQTYMQENNMELQEGDMSRALVALKPEAASIPTPKLKNVSRLRTEHQVYELPDSHPLLNGMDRREPDDPSPYLLAIWTPGETANSIQPPERSCRSQESGKLCNETTCFSCNSIREAKSQTVRGTLLIPCRTAMRGSFPLNGTYFQVNEVFADHDSSLNPVDVPRAWIWNLPRRTVYFGTSVSTIFKGLSTEGIQFCFWRGFVCVRGFDQKTRAPRPLMARLHFPASKLVKTKNEKKNDT